MIVYSKNSGYHDAAIGRIETPIKMIIEHESDLLTEKGGICDALFNVEKSQRFGETIVGGNEFDSIQYTAEGGNAVQDTTLESYQKFIEHIQFTKEFVVTAEMMEDANYGVAADAKHRAENFVRASYKTMNKICEHALINGTQINTDIAGAVIDLTTGDDNPLFFNRHGWGVGDTYGEQSNYFYCNIFSSDGTSVSADYFEESLYALASKIRNMKDESGEPMGYTADTIIIPGNNPRVESVVKKVCGSYGSTGNGNNDVAGVVNRYLFTARILR